jgi:spermidine synthase
MRRRTWAIALVLFGSGFCALVYQIAWFREFRLIFGASTAASAAVLAIFIGGLGGGGLLIGPRADHHPRPLLFYAGLEALVAVSAAASPFLLSLVRTAYIASGGTAALGAALGAIARLVLGALVLAVPTLAMGGTLPAAARAATRANDSRRRDVAALYGMNTLGAVAGCMLATFVLLEIYGTRSTLWLATAINLLVAIGARALDRRWAGRPQAAPPPSLGAPASLAAPAAPAAFVLIAAASLGFAFFLMELVWYRLLAPLLGGSVFTFGLVLAVALFGIGAGGLLYAITSEHRPPTLAGFAVSCLLEAAAVAATFALGDRLALLALVLQPLRTGGFAPTVAGWTLITTITVLPPALVSGYQFPLLIALLGRGRDAIGRQIGFAYAANTLGAIAGSLAGGFGLLPWLTAPGAWRLVAMLLIVLGAAAVLLDAGRATAARFVAQGALAAFACLLALSTGPTTIWRHSGIGAGRVSEDVLASANQLRGWQQTMRQRIYWQGDGVESSVALTTDPTGFAFVVNGKSDGAARGDAGTQVMLGLIGAIMHPSPRTALVVGLGTGSSAGWLAAVPTIERVDVVELEPLVVEVARASTPVNHGALENPKVHLVIGDAREVLLTARDRYDVIASEPSNPFRAGIASLFTEEFYRAAYGRLTDDGVFAQWVQGYEIDAPTLQTIYVTLAAVFPQVEAWQTHRGDLVLLAARLPRTTTVSALATRIAQEPYRSALAHVWRADSVTSFLGHFIASDGMARALLQSPAVSINTDDRNIVEFGFARSVGRSRALIVPELRRAARSAGFSRPSWSDAAAVDWSAVETARLAFDAANGTFDGEPAAADARERARRLAIVRFFQAADTGGAYAAWNSQPGDPRDLIETRVIAAIEADRGSESALSWIERIRTWEPAEAEVLVALLRFRQQRFDEAAAALEAALVGFRTDPWVIQQAMVQAIGLVQPVAAAAPASAKALYEALAKPFVVHAADGPRLVEAADLSRRLDFAATCRTPIAQLEPFVPWTEFFLRLRRDCYLATGDLRLTTAERELAEFYANEPAPLLVPIKSPDRGATQ